MSLPRAAIGIHLNSGRLAGPQVAKLRLLEVGRYPDVVQRHDVYQFLSDAYVLPAFDAPLANDSGNRRANDCVAESELSLIQFRLAL